MAFFVKNRLAYVAPLPARDLQDEIVVITGGNTGIGLELAIQLATMKPKKLIVTGRTLSKMDEPLEQIKRQSGFDGVQAMQLDLNSNASIKEFADSVAGQPGARLDMLFCNAGVAGLPTFSLSEGHETTMQTNVYGTLLLTLLLLPLLQSTTKKRGQKGPASINLVSGSQLGKLPTDVDILATCDSEEETAKAQSVPDSPRAAFAMPCRYPLSKSVLYLIMREMAGKLQDVVVLAATPGFCRTSLSRNVGGWGGTAFRLWVWLIARPPDAGARSIALPMLSDDIQSAHGKFFSEGVEVASSGRPYLAFAASPDGQQIGKELWRSCIKELAKVDGRVMQVLA